MKASTMRAQRDAIAQSCDARDAFARDMLSALRHRPRSIAPKYFYDAAGSALFDRICDLPEYYPTRTEIALLTQHAGEIAQCMGKHAELVEFGSGAMRKVRLLLDALDAPTRYMPIDISGEHLESSLNALAQHYPGLEVQGVVADYTALRTLPSAHAKTRQRIGFFPGSTIGNFMPDEALGFLKQAASLLRGGALLLGVDMVKAPDVLHAAYNDAQGVTAAFNLNLLARANAELGADFDLGKFAHSAFYNAPLRRIEMHLVSLQAQDVTVCGECFYFGEGETLHTENSYKYTADGVRRLARDAGFEPVQEWTDADGWFRLFWLRSA
jgi:dimethylhistidine N-methyltransferase